MIDLNQLKDIAHNNAIAHGFHEIELSNEHWLMLVITELSEAVEADRKGKRANIGRFNAFDKDNKYDQKRHAQRWERPKHDAFSFESTIKDTVEDELADAVIRLLDLAGLRNIDMCFPTEWVDDMEVSCEDETFIESIYSISNIPCKHELLYSHTIGRIVNYMVAAIFGLAKHIRIDLLFHIECKMQYNKSRPNKHGKKY